MHKQFIETLVESDFIGFSDGKSVARIFSQNKGWYIGTCMNISFDNSDADLCLIRLDLFMSFDRYPPAADPQDPGEVIFTRLDRVKGKLRVNEPPFRLFEPQRIIDANPASPVLIIRGHEEHVRKAVVISKRLQDIATVNGIKEFAQFLTTS